MCLIDWSFAKSFKSSSNFAKKLAQKVLENICITKIAKICIEINRGFDKEYGAGYKSDHKSLSLFLS